MASRIFSTICCNKPISSGSIHGIDILVDANTRYTLVDVHRIMPAYDKLGIGWLKEPFPERDLGLYVRAARLGCTPLAARENHYTRYEFEPLIASGIRISPALGNSLYPYTYKR